MKTVFKVSSSNTEIGVQVVEVWQDGIMTACIYDHPEDVRGIRVLSEYPSEITRQPDWPTDFNVKIFTESSDPKK